MSLFRSGQLQNQSAISVYKLSFFFSSYWREKQNNSFPWEWRAKETAHLRKYLRGRHEHLRPIPRTHIKRKDPAYGCVLVAHHSVPVKCYCSPSNGKVETGDSLGLYGHLAGKLPDNKRLSQSTRWMVHKGWYSKLTSRLHTCTHTERERHLHACTQRQKKMERMFIIESTVPPSTTSLHFFRGLWYNKRT